MGEAVLFPRMGTIKEAADASGLAIYRVRHLVASGKIRYIRAGRRFQRGVGGRGMAGED